MEDRLRHQGALGMLMPRGRFRAFLEDGLGEVLGGGFEGFILFGSRFGMF